MLRKCISNSFHTYYEGTLTFFRFVRIPEIWHSAQKVVFDILGDCFHWIFPRPHDGARLVCKTHTNKTKRQKQYFGIILNPETFLHVERTLPLNLKPVNIPLTFRRFPDSKSNILIFTFIHFFVKETFKTFLYSVKPIIFRRFPDSKSNCVIFTIIQFSENPSKYSYARQNHTIVVWLGAFKTKLLNVCIGPPKALYYAN